MPRSLIRGSQVLDGSLKAGDLDKNSIVAELYNYFSVSTIIGRIKLTTDILENTDFILPGGLKYNNKLFVEKVAIYRNGQLLYNGLIQPVSNNDPTDVYPGSDNTKVKFTGILKKGDTIQVMIL